MKSKDVKVAYIVLAFLLALCAIVASYLQQYYVALGLIVLASAIMLGGAFLISHLYRMEKAEELKKI